ncbi:MAG: hypothetical protein P8Z38_10335 [Robiginitalea sp.]
MKSRLIVFLLGIATLFSCKESKTDSSASGYQGQGPNPIVSTRTKPVQKQWRGRWVFQDSTVFFSNQFEGARLNGVAHDGVTEAGAGIIQK